MCQEKNGLTALLRGVQKVAQKVAQKVVGTCVAGLEATNHVGILTNYSHRYILLNIMCVAECVTTQKEYS